MKARQKRKLVIVVLLVLAAGGAYFWIAHKPAKTVVAPTAAGHAATPQLATAGRQPAAPTHQPPAPQAAQPPVPAPQPLQATAASPLDAAQAAQSLQRGLELMNAGKLLAARGELSSAIFSGALDDAQAEQARAAATSIADTTILSPEILDGDPYTFQYTLESGQTLNTVERKLMLHVPPQLILRINRLTSDRSIRAGQTVKMVQGPFHAIISNSNFTLDLYLSRQGLEKVFIRRLKVGLGADGSTPVGSWKVGKGKKNINTTWYPPPSSTIRTPQRPGDPNYPLGKTGYWIGLVGTDRNTATADGYGLHGTNDPASIGRAASLGCIRLADGDIELVYSLLYEEWSTVQVTP